MLPETIQETTWSAILSQYVVLLLCLVTWHKGARDLVYTNRHRVLNDGDSYMMQIKSTLSTDKGEFSVTAENEHGKIQGVICVNILPRRDEEEWVFLTPCNLLKLECS